MVWQEYGFFFPKFTLRFHVSKVQLCRCQYTLVTIDEIYFEKYWRKTYCGIVTTKVLFSASSTFFFFSLFLCLYLYLHDKFLAHGFKRHLTVQTEIVKPVFTFLCTFLRAFLWCRVWNQDIALFGYNVFLF